MLKNHMRKLLSGITAATLAVMQIFPVTLPVYAAGEDTTVEISIADVECLPGDTVDVEISIDKTTTLGVASMMFDLYYDETAMSCVGMNRGSNYSDTTLRLNDDGKKVRIYFVGDMANNFKYTGSLVTLSFKINDNADFKAYSFTEDTVNPLNNVSVSRDSNGKLVRIENTLNFNGGKITVKKSENTGAVAKPEIQNTTPDGFVIKAQAGYEYYVSETNSVPNGAVWTTNTTVTGKLPNTTYYVFGRIAATNTTEASAPSVSTSVKVPNNDASLKSLNVAGGTLSPAFSSETYDYTVTVPYGGSISNAVVVLNDTNASYEFTKTASDFGANNITGITVTAENGADTKVYTVTYSEINAVLSALTVNGTSVTGFNPDITSYTYSIPYTDWKNDTAKTYTITATASKDTSTVSISDNNFTLTNTDSDNNSTKNVTVTVTAAGGEITTYTIKFEVLACSHTNKSVTDSAPADCTTDGYEDYECPDCGKTDRKTLTALGHDWSSEWTIDIPADCINDGSKSHHCSRCGNKNDVTVISALGHKWGFWTQVGDTENYERICSVCNANETKTAQDISHEHVFNGVAEIITQPTCTTEGLQKVWCSVESCPEFVEESINKITHTEGTPVINPTPTCISVGISTIKCTVCGTTISTSEVPMTNHSYGTVYEGNAEGHWQVCSVCNGKSETTAHTENSGIVTTPATSSSNGIRTYSCTVCGYELRTEVIPATGSDLSIDYTTGDYTGAPVIPVGGVTTENMTVKVENKVTGKASKAIAQKNGNSVSVKLGTENNGYYANVYTTDDEYIYSTLVENGRARFNVPDDVKIKIVIDSISYGEDVSSAAKSHETTEILSDNLLYLAIIILLVGISVIVVLSLKKCVKNKTIS